MADTATRILLTDSSGNARYLSVSFTGDVLTILDANSGKTLTVDMAAHVTGSNTGDQDLSGKADLVAGKVPATQLPSYVDDVLEYANLAAFPATGETGKIYVAIDTNLTFRWSGSVYVGISVSLALGETSATAYRGDRGKAAYDHSQASAAVHGLAGSVVGTTDAQTLTNKILDQLKTAQVATAADQPLPWGSPLNTHKVPIVLNGITYYLHLTTA